MNQTPEELKTVSNENYALVLDPATFVPQESSPEADLVALEAISALEAEEGTSEVVEPAQVVPPVVDVMTPFVPEQPTVTTKDVLSASAPKDNLAQTNSNPFPKPTKSPKKLVIVLIAIVALIGGAVAAYFIWQSVQPINSTINTETTTGNQPGSVVIPVPTDS
jgi:hypothetical protein